MVSGIAMVDSQGITQYRFGLFPSSASNNLRPIQSSYCLVACMVATHYVYGDV